MNCRTLCSRIGNQLLPQLIVTIQNCKDLKEFRSSVINTFEDIKNVIDKHESNSLKHLNLKNRCELKIKPIENLEIQRFSLDLKSSDKLFLDEYAERVH